MFKKTINKKTSLSSHNRNWRISVLVFFVFIASAVIFIRLYVLQVGAYEKYARLAGNQHKIFEELVPKRGEIYLADDKDVYPVAVNQELQMAYAVPKEIVDREKTVEKISEILRLERNEVSQKFSNPDDMYEVLKRKLSDEETEKIKEAGLPGIHLAPESFRFYPGGEIASQIVGFVGYSGDEYRGQYGIEAFWDEKLKGQPGSVSQERDTRGRWISIADREMLPAQNGDSLVLTVNHTVQYEVEKILRETVQNHKADNGTIIAMEVKTGKLLALSNWPTFNPNEYSKTEDISVFLNPVVSAPYECGSVFKAITAAAAIDDGKVEPDTTYVDTGSVNEAGYTIKNSEEKTYGRKTMTQVLENSINTGAIFMERQVGNKKFSDYLHSFGLGEKTGVALPNESAGNIKNLEELKRNINFYTASFGQGISVTPLQLILAYAAIGNNGKLMKPQIVEKIIHDEGDIEEIKPQEIRQVVSEETAKKVERMLLSVVESGHGKKAAVAGYLVGGKTGTAQVSKVGSKGYEEGLTIGSFAGLAPIDDPQFAVLVKITNPKDVQWAESTAAPAFSQVMGFLLKYYGVKPTEE